MENDNVRIILVFTIFGVLGLCGFCVGMSLLWGLMNYLSTPAPTMTGLQTQSLTSFGTSLASITPSPTPVLAITPGGPSLTPGLGVSPTGSPTFENTETPTPTEESLELTPTPTVTTIPTQGAGLSDAWCVPWNTPSIRGRVIRAIDGISFEVSADGNTFLVRYIGIGVPAPDNNIDTEYEAFAKNKMLIEGKEVLLIQDQTPVDEGGYLPRYVMVGGTFANQEMISSGYAIASSTPPDIRCDQFFQQAEESAILSDRGFWAPTPTPSRTRPAPTTTPARTGNVIISYIFYQGEPWEQPNEFVEIHNVSDGTIQLKGWSLKDNQNHVFVFPEYLLLPDQFCRVYTYGYHPTTCGFSYFSRSPIWDDLGDCAYLKDSLGLLVDQFCYE
jgi:endonuclease YncB( thermonuclease family)